MAGGGGKLAPRPRATDDLRTRYLLLLKMMSEEAVWLAATLISELQVSILEWNFEIPETVWGLSHIFFNTWALCVASL